MPGLRSVARGAPYPRRRAPAVDPGTTVTAIATVMVAVALYALVWWVLGATDDDGEVFGSAPAAPFVAGAESGAPSGSSRA